eukprot:m.17224 g.17224  ORF g.17224 m.17224 type:complete len:655 (+) comp27390_c0_seq2:80-2044(+)
MNVMGDVVAEAKSNRFTTIPTLSDQDVVSVWEVVSSFIERQMNQQKGVQVPGLGLFTFSQRKLDLSSSKAILIQRPVFQLSEKFARNHLVEHTKEHVSGHVPVVQLNYTAVSMESPFDRDTVERCVREVLLALSRCVQKNRTVEFTFAGIGRLAIRNSKAKMKFFKEFITSMDGTGHLMKAFSSSRASSVAMGNTPRPASTVALPKIVQPDSPLLSLDGTKMESRRSVRSGGEMPPIPEGSIVAQYGSETELDKGPKETAIKDDNDNGRVAAAAVTPPPAMPALSQSSPKESAKSGPSSSPGQTTTAIRPSTCSHGMTAGQELCYLCHQREMRNVPVSFADERRARQLYEDRFLQQYQQKKDSLALFREQAKETKNREINRKMAGYNFEASESRKRVARERSVDRYFQRSYVFDKRPATEPSYARQLRYSQELAGQMNAHKSGRESLRKETDILERLEQIQLAEELADSRDLYLLQKATANQQYQLALREQIRCKPLPLPAAQPDSLQPIFGVHDVTDKKLKQKRLVAENVFRDQLQAEREKEETVSRRHRLEQEDELKMLQRTKRELIEDMKIRHQERTQRRNELEQSWAELATEKKAREAEEAVLERRAGTLLQEQCDKYGRCQQCKRRPDNVGKSNVLKETRYISGARLIL